MGISETLVCVCVALTTFSCLRHIFWKFMSKGKIPCKIFIVLGSGGHTSEILNYARVLNRTVFTPRIYIHSKSDDLSVGKAKCLEDSNKAGTAEYVAITRAREVGQSWISSIFTTLKATVDSFWILLKWTPDLIVCNGPGVCLPICVLAKLLTVSAIKTETEYRAKILVNFEQIVGVRNIRVVFIESLCRAETLSLTGHLLLHMVDGFIVQWKDLAKKYKGTTFLPPIIE